MKMIFNLKILRIIDAYRVINIISWYLLFFLKMLIKYRCHWILQNINFVLFKLTAFGTCYNIILAY